MGPGEGSDEVSSGARGCVACYVRGASERQEQQDSERQPAEGRPPTLRDVLVSLAAHSFRLVAKLSQENQPAAPRWQRSTATPVDNRTTRTAPLHDSEPGNPPNLRIGSQELKEWQREHGQGSHKFSDRARCAAKALVNVVGIAFGARTKLFASKPAPTRNRISREGERLFASRGRSDCSEVRPECSCRGWGARGARRTCRWRHPLPCRRW